MDLDYILNEVAHILKLMNDHEVPYALIGGLAVGMHGHIRATEDIDILISDSNSLDQIDVMLRDQAWHRNHSEIPLRDSGEIHRWVKFNQSEYLVLDIMISPQNPQWMDDRVSVDIKGIPSWLIGRDHLIAMKKAAGRPKDLNDIIGLEDLT